MYKWRCIGLSGLSADLSAARPVLFSKPSSRVTSPATTRALQGPLLAELPPGGQTALATAVANTFAKTVPSLSAQSIGLVGMSALWVMLISPIFVYLSFLLIPGDGMLVTAMLLREQRPLASVHWATGRRAQNRSTDITWRCHTTLNSPFCSMFCLTYRYYSRVLDQSVCTTAAVLCSILFLGSVRKGQIKVAYTKKLAVHTLLEHKVL